MWFNFHSHSRYCDGKGDLADYVEASRRHGFVSVGFSSHAPLPFECKWAMKAENLSSYLDEIDGLKKGDHENIYKGLEIDFIPGVVSPGDFHARLDYAIGSIHFVDSFPDGRRWEIDNTQAVFNDGLQRIFNGNIKDAVCRYFELTREMIEAGPFHILGHVDKIKMQNEAGKLFSEQDAWYRDQVMQTLSLVQKAGLIVEVNTRGLYQKKTTTTYPSPWILAEILKKKIPITLSSDAHIPDDIINRFAETASMLAKMGFTKLMVLHEGQWKQFSFNEHGIIR